MHRLPLLLATTFATTLSLPAVGFAQEQHPTTSPADTQSAALAQNIQGEPVAVVKGGPAQGEQSERLFPVAAFYGPMPTGLALSNDNTKTFVCFPRWQDPTNFTVARLTSEGLEPFPNAEINQYLPEDPTAFPAAEHFVSVQSVYVGREGRLWILDTGSINFGTPVDGGPKLWAYDVDSGEAMETFDFGEVGGEVIKEKTYLNDVRFDFSRGEGGYAFITDSGAGGIIVLDLASGESWRKLDGHPSVLPDPDVTLQSEGNPLPAKIASDGIAVAPDGQSLYYSPLTSRTIYAVPLASLVDPKADAAKDVREVATKPSGNDGIDVDRRGNIYSTDFEDNAIRRIDPRTGDVEVVVQDERVIWPDSIVVADGLIMFTSNQLPRQPQFNGGQEKREGGYYLFALPVEGIEGTRSAGN